MARRSKDLKRILRKLDRLGKEPREKLTRAVVRAAERVAAVQRQFAEDSRDTGALIESITVTGPGQTTPPYSEPGDNRKAGPTEALITVGDTDVRYPHLIEFGSVKAEARPFFWPAYRLMRKRAQNAITRAGRKAIRDIWGGKT